jgi:hypothetical protein
MNLTPMIAIMLCTLPQQSDDALKAQAKSALEATGLRFDLTESGKSYKIVFNHPGNRTQTVYMSLTPNKVSGLITYNFYTQLWSNANPPDEATMRKILGRTKKLGAFYLFKDSKGIWGLRFNARFDATDLAETPKSDDASVKAIKDLIYFVNTVGEETDKELNGEKDMR